MHAARQNRPDLDLLVTQAELAEVRELRAQKQQCDQLAADIRRRILAGAYTQRGRLIAEVTQHDVRRFSERALVEILGRAAVEELRADLPLTHVFRLDIIESGL